MLNLVLQSAIQSGVFEKFASFERFKSKVVPQACVVPSSVVRSNAGIFLLCEKDGEAKLLALSQHEKTLSAFTGQSVSEHKGGFHYVALECPQSHANAAALRDTLRWTGPSRLTASQSFGFGDRIGSPSPATPWHIEATVKYGMTPVLAQQSVRENHKTGRTFESVMDDTTWSVLKAGYKKTWGADADHLKNIEEIEDAVNAGFTMFTLDPSEKIDHDADSDSVEVLSEKLAGLFDSETAQKDFIARYSKGDTSADDIVISAVKYLPAVRHAITAYKRLVELLGESNFNFEMSIDETTEATTVLDHKIIATELSSADVELFSLAPRFEGAFEKGIDYMGTVDGFRRSLEHHAKLARELGGYRLSLHSGSDKFSIYPSFGEITDGYYHVKTAGTSYLEAVKVTALDAFDLFKRILSLSQDTFEENVASYEISADASNVPPASDISQDDAVDLITNSPDMRQVLHIAFGVVLKSMGDDLKSVLQSKQETYRNCIVNHLGKHLALLTGK